ncbi:hypothetical protein A3K55_01230 [Candidatus Shapirobacteria bacterium RBG_13_44_7]|uniref:Ribbon-helix-helix protein CopG domain-containing protein n=1 Tax=Candidatus Shapirobacteria bacterium RBG_13_44_7 TaxID=1802149 RepID=A0A1F7SKF3_9BACT|nr:MAG: hypothetical protein A3K55_01230 [Candidatus Shapirobacteria bacterium RBG_13_44_7]
MPRGGKFEVVVKKIARERGIAPGEVIRMAAEAILARRELERRVRTVVELSFAVGLGFVEIRPKHQETRQ